MRCSTRTGVALELEYLSLECTVILLARCRGSRLFSSASTRAVPAGSDR